MRFVKLSATIHVNLDSLVLVGNDENSKTVTILTTDGYREEFDLESPETSILMQAIEAYSDASFYNQSVSNTSAV